MKKKQEAACADSDCRLGRDLYYCEKKADSQKDSRVYDEGSKMYSGRAGGAVQAKESRMFWGRRLAYGLVFRREVQTL